MTEGRPTTRMRGAIHRVDSEWDERFGGRYYQWEGHKFWSVTSILSALPKEWLAPWARKQTAIYAVEHLATLEAMLNDGHEPDDVVDWLKKASDRRRDKAANLGSRVHAAAESYALHEPYPEWDEDVAPYMHGFEKFLEEWEPTFIAIEAPVFSRKYWYAGTLDCILEVDGVRYIVDYKSGRSVYEEVALQLAAYRYGETFIGLPDADEEPIPEVAGGLAIHLRPDDYKVVPVRVDQEMFDMFKYVREVFRWTKEMHKTALGRDSQRVVCVREGCGHPMVMHGAGGCWWPEPPEVVNAEPFADAKLCHCVGMRKTPLKKELVTK